MSVGWWGSVSPWGCNSLSLFAGFSPWSPSGTHRRLAQVLRKNPSVGQVWGREKQSLRKDLTPYLPSPPCPFWNKSLHLQEIGQNLVFLTALIKLREGNRKTKTKILHPNQGARIQKKKTKTLLPTDAVYKKCWSSSSRNMYGNKDTKSTENWTIEGKIHYKFFNCSKKTNDKSKNSNDVFVFNNAVHMVEDNL